MEIKIIPDRTSPKLDLLSAPLDYGKNNKELIDSLINFVKYKNAVGLAANQVSIDGNVLMDRFFLEKINFKDPDNSKGIWRAIINPVILSYSGMTDVRLEGCLTWVGKTIIALRTRCVKVAYCDIEGKYFEETITGFRANIWQHEINHLNGGVEEFFTGGRTQKSFELKVERNEKCPCRSGLKYKNCCYKFEI